MNKKTFALSFGLILLAVFNIIFFLWTDTETRSNAVWASYGFMTFSCLIMTATAAWSNNKGEAYSLTIPYVGIVYCTMTFAAAMLSLLCHFDFKVVITIQTILTAIYLMRLMMHYTANRATADDLARRQEAVTDRNAVISRSKRLAALADGTEASKAVQELSQTIISMPLNRLNRVISSGELDATLSAISEALAASDTARAREIAAKATRTINL